MPIVLGSITKAHVRLPTDLSEASVASWPSGMRLLQGAKQYGVPYMAIGVATANIDHIVIASDEPANENREDTEESIINYPLPHGWHALIAGDRPVIDALSVFLEESFEALDENEDDHVLRAIHRALRNFKRFIIDNDLHLEYGMTYKEFREASHLLNAAKVASEITRVRELPFPAELLIIGFAKTDNAVLDPLIFSVTSNWEVELESSLAAIGRASNFAQSTLLTRAVHRTEYSVDDLIYVTYESKRTAEEARSVQVKTALSVISSDGSIRNLTPQSETQLAKLYAVHRPRPLSENIRTLELLAS